jgi:hypothetical protein
VNAAATPRKPREQKVSAAGAKTAVVIIRSATCAAQVAFVRIAMTRALAIAVVLLVRRDRESALDASAPRVPSPRRRVA